MLTLSYYMNESDVENDIQQNLPPLPEPERKLLNINAIIRCHDKQIQRLQRDQTKRIEDYRLLKCKLESDRHELQKQIDDIRNDLQGMYEKAALVDKVSERLSQCEEQTIQMQIHNDDEFEVLRGVMMNVCGRIDRIEELQSVEREHRIQQQQQQHQQQQRHEHHKQQQQQAQRNQDQQGTMRIPVHAPAPKSAMSRVLCPHCNKELSKTYLRTHLKYKRCKLC